ncbi:MAG TPA: PAS domain S-box protein, partial [Chthoniobacteraceae bacterium]|nr:PAS domain S-box protein [Chthoniobacteraceae bacterium]
MNPKSTELGAAPLAEDDVRRPNAVGRQADDIFRLVVEATPNAIILANAEGRILLANAGAEKLFGYPRAELIGQPVEMLLPEPMRAAHPGYREAYAKHAEARPMGQGRDLFARRKDGSQVPVEIGLNPIETPEGVLILGAIIDISERKRVEAAAARLVAIVESSADAIVGKDLEGCVTSWNAGAERMFGYTASEMLGAQITRIIPLDRRDDETKILARIKRGERIEHFETQRLRKDGKLIEVSVTVSPVKDAQGQVVGASKMARDITERKQAEEATRASEARYRTLFEHAPDGIVVVDAEGNYLDGNQSICRMLGYTREEFVQLNASDVVAQEEFPHIGAALDVIKTKADYQREWKFRRKDGSVFSVDTIATAMPGGNLLAMIRDITERKRAEEALRASETRLQAVTENLSEGLIVSSLDGRLLHWNRAGLEMHGFRTLAEGLRKLPEFADTFAVELLDGTSVPFEQWPLQRVLSGEVLRDFEVRLRRFDRDWERVFNFSGQIVHDATGQPLAYLAINDITARRRTEAALREKEEQLHATDRRLAEIVQGMTEACFALDAQWRFTFVNDRGETLLKQRREEMLGRSIWEVFHKLVGTPMEAHYRRAMAERTPLSFEAFS